MKRFACGDVVPGCQARFTGDSAESILEQVAEHARHAHGLDQVTPELRAGVLAAIG
jgi:predicted small metal-binding protein